MTGLRRLIPRAVVRHLRGMQHRAQIRAIARAHAARRPVTPAPLLDVAVVIPVHDDAHRLARLLDSLRPMGLSQIVVVDDGSAVPVVATGVTLIRHDTALGPGPARSAGVAAVTASHLIFIDSDDLPTADLAGLLADLAATDPTTPDLAGPDPFDICLFKYADSRFSNPGHWGQPPWDDAFWQAAGLATGALAEAPRAVWPLLAQTANYPWNKVYRTGFLRDHDIRCATTPVHEDLTLHWLCFHHAARILTSDRVCVWHMVAADAGRQTNRRGAERLAVFDAMAPVVAVLTAPDLRCALVGFVLGLADWIRGTLDAPHHADLDAALHHWLHVTIAGWHGDIATHDPALMARIATLTAPAPNPTGPAP